MRREIITWSIVGALILAAFGGTVLTLNASLYSASGFVRSYLDALARHDSEGALELAGTTMPSGASRELLAPAAMGELSDIQLVNETANTDGTTTVVYSYLAGGKTGESTFEVQRKGTLLGLFTTWSFATSPLSVLQLSVLHATDFTANGVALSAPEQDVATPYLVFTPTTFQLAHDSHFLHADPISVTASQPSAAVVAALDVQANPAFVKQVQKELNSYLDECTTQQVLYPTGCPFGQDIGNRIASAPVWSMTSYPEVTLVPGPDPGSWLMPPTGAAAHLVVEVQSLFDGSMSTFDEDVPFSSSYLVTFLPGNQVYIKAQYR